MSGNGTQIHYTPPDDPGVWYAPETVAWAVCLLLAALAVTLAVRPLLYRLLDRAQSKEGAGKLAPILAMRSASDPAPMRRSLCRSCSAVMPPVARPRVGRGLGRTPGG